MISPDWSRVVRVIPSTATSATTAEIGTSAQIYQTSPVHARRSLKPRKAMLDLIPKEILREIIDKIPRTRDRNSISQVSRKLYAFTLPTLYESITVRSRDESNLAQTNIDEFLKTANRDYFKYVKRIFFFAPIETNDQFRCLHYKLLSEADQDAIRNRDEDLVSRIDNLGDLMPQIRPLFDSLPDNHLKSFYWHLGTCLPRDILGPGGYLPTKQSGIEDLSLITSDPCILPKDDWGYQISLAEFKSLKKFSWSGGLSREYFNALRDMFSIHSGNLEVLKIDLIDWWDAQWNWSADDGDLQHWIRDHNFFGEKVLGLTPGGTQVLLPSLKSLTLSSVQFQGASLEMAHAFNISRLQSLNLRDCPHSGSLLRKVVQSGEPIHLRSLELVVRHNSSGSYRKEEHEDWIEPFLFSFNGLKNLKLLVLNGKGVSTTHRYWPSIFRHRHTLTKLVYHELRYNHEWLDCNIDMQNDKILKFFTLMNLECIGSCISPIIPAEATFSQLTVAQVKTLRVLCLRATGLRPEFEHYVGDYDDRNKATYEFAGWAFKMFPNLLFIATGDFSYGSQYKSSQEILYRHPFPGMDSSGGSPSLQPVASQSQNSFDGFRQLHPEDRLISSHLEQFREILEACPAEPLFRKDF